MRHAACRVVLALALSLPADIAAGQTALSATAGVERIEPTAPATQPGDQAWYDARQLETEGKGWKETENFYERLPAKAKNLVTPAVWELSKNTAGLCVRFSTDASLISARWTVTSPGLSMPHMPATGVSGVDLYVRHGNKYHWIGNSRPLAQTSEMRSVPTQVGPGAHEYLLYLPLYNGTQSLEIGIPSKASMYRIAPRREKPICVYGTSIVQGGCASRPGMAHVAILGRRLDWPMINLGFSGAGVMEPAMADLLAELDAAAYVLDCLPNLTTEQVEQRLEPFVESLRKARPDTPIVLMESVIPQSTVFLPASQRDVTPKNGALAKCFEHLQSKGVSKLLYIPGDPLLGNDGDGTVDGVHPTDLGFLRMAEAMEPTLRPLVAGR